MTQVTPPRAPARRVPFSDLRGFSRLYADYTARFEAVAGYYGGDWRDAGARAAAAERAAAHPRDRAAVADVLLEQNERWGLDERTRRHIEQLRDPASAAVVTGQQVGLLAGPLYTVYKTITALQLARRLAEETGRPVVPVFWVEGEDHDFDEIAGLRLLHRNDTVAVRYPEPATPEGGNHGAVGRIELTEEALAGVAEGIDEALAPSDFKGGVMEAVREAYRPGALLEDAFVHFMKALFPDAGLVFLNPDDARLKGLSAGLFRKELEDHATVAERLRAVSAELEETYHAQVHARPTNLFLLDEAGRFPIDAREDGTYALRGTDRVYTQAELLERLAAHPEQFSPNVVLRPLMQDTLVPTAAYVAGPGEVAYYAQYRPVYEWAGLPMPVIYPRASVTLVESKVEKVLDRYGLGVADVGEELEKLFRRVVLEAMEVDVDAAFKDAGSHLHQAVNALKPTLEGIDRTLVKSAEATRAALMKEFEKLKERAVRAEKRGHDEVREQLAKVRVNLYPDGKQQERALSVLYFINKYSPGLLGRLEAELSLDTAEHQVVLL